MGLCSSKKLKKDESGQNQVIRAETQTRVEILQNNGEQFTQSNTQTQQNQIQQQQKAKPQAVIGQQSQNDEEDIMKSIIQQFDELNTLFTEMQKEFEQISQYLLRDEDQNQIQ